MHELLVFNEHMAHCIIEIQYDVHHVFVHFVSFSCLSSLNIIDIAWKSFLKIFSHFCQCLNELSQFSPSRPQWFCWTLVYDFDDWHEYWWPIPYDSYVPKNFECMHWWFVVSNYNVVQYGKLARLTIIRPIYGWLGLKDCG